MYVCSITKYIDFWKPISDNSKQSVSLDVKTMLLCNIWLAAVSTRESCWLRGRRRAAARGVILCVRGWGNRILIDCEHVWWQCCFYLESIQWDSGQRSHACFDGAKAFSSTATLEPLATRFLKKNAASLASHRTKRSPSALLHCTLTHAECLPFFLPSF